MPSYVRSSLYNGKCKAQASVSYQLRIGIARLNGYLSKINAVESGMCSCNMGAETVHYFLFCCPVAGATQSEHQALGLQAQQIWGGDTLVFFSCWSMVWTKQRWRRKRPGSLIRRQFGPLLTMQLAQVTTTADKKR